MAAHINDESGDSWEIAVLYMDLLPRDHAKPLKYLDKLNLVHYFKISSDGAVFADLLTAQYSQFNGNYQAAMYSV